MTYDDGQMKPFRGKYEDEDENDESWHDAREDGWETVACGKAKNEAATGPEAEAKGRDGDEEIKNRHVREPIRSGFQFGWDAIRTWIGRPKQDHA